MTAQAKTQAKPRGRPPIQDADYNAARARKMEADAQMAELELLQAKRKLVSADDVTTAWVDVLSAMKAKLLALPSKCAPIAATETDIQIIQTVIENQIREALDELSAYQPHEHAGRSSVSNGGDGQGDANPKTPTKAHGRSVGRPRKASKLGS
jgi:phage terminase Nu1 subunit (DNA packaging protein)